MTSSSNAKFLCLRCFNCASPREALLYTVTGCLSYAARTLVNAYFITLDLSFFFWGLQVRHTTAYVHNLLHLSFTYVIVRCSCPRMVKVAPWTVGHTVEHQTKFSWVDGLLLTFISMGHAARTASYAMTVRCYSATPEYIGFSV